MTAPRATSTPTARASRPRLIPDRVAFAVLMTVLTVQAAIVGSFARSWPPAWGDGRTVLSLLAGVVAVVVWWRSELHHQGGER